MAEDFGIDIDWIYYKDNSGREIDYDFSQGELLKHIGNQKIKDCQTKRFLKKSKVTEPVLAM